MDLLKGMEKLRAFQLLDKERYGLLLMAAAFWRRAEVVEIHSDRDGFEMTWVCQPLDREEMQSLFRLDGRLVPLGLALIHAQALNPVFIRLDSGASRLELKRGQARLEDLFPPCEGLRFHLRERLGKRLLRRFRPGASPESRLIAEACHGTGRRILINGLPIPARVDLGPCQELWLFTHDGFDPPDIEPQAPLRTEKVSLPYQAVVAVGEHLTRSGLTIVAQGQRFEMPQARVEPFFRVLLMLPTHPTDLACASLIQNEDLVKTLDDLEDRVDRGLLRIARENRASDPLLVAILERLKSRRMLTDWVEILGLLLDQQSRFDPAALAETLQRATTPPPDMETPLDAPAFQEKLALVLGRLKERRGRFLTLAELNQLADSAACLHLLRPAGGLARQVADEVVFLLVAAGHLKTAAAILHRSGVRDERLGLLLLCLGEAEEAAPLLTGSFARGLLAFYQGDYLAADDRLGEAETGVEGLARLVLLDHRARALALRGEFSKATSLVNHALDSSTGLDREGRLGFRGALEKGRLDYFFEPSAYGMDERWPDLRERGLALSSPHDRQAARRCLDLLRQGWERMSQEPYAALWETGTIELGAAHPMMRALGRALGDRYLQAGNSRKGLTVSLIPELLALWPKA